MDIKRDEKGQTLLIFSLFFVAVLLFAGLALDGGMLYVSHRNAQTAADASAFAGATALTLGKTTDEAKGIASGRAATNGFNNDQTTNWVTVNYPPASGPYTGQANYFQVIIRSKINTSFIHLIYPGAAESTSEAVVSFTASSPVGGPNALIGLSKNDCDTVLVNGNMDVTIDGGSILSNSSADTHTCYSMEKKGTSGNIKVKGGGIKVVGGFNNTGQSTFISPAPTTGVGQISSLFIPPPDCSCDKNLFGQACANANVNVKNNTVINPGIYHDITLNSNNDKLTMNPGLYCITGSFTATGGRVSGNNVTIVMEGGTLDLTGNLVVDLAAVEPPPGQVPPDTHAYYVSTDGNTYDYVGLMVYADPSKYTGISDTDTIAIGGSNGNTFTGTVYAPNTTCKLSGTSGTITYNSQVYCYTVTISGNANITMNFSATQNWPAPAMLKLEY